VTVLESRSSPDEAVVSIGTATVDRIQGHSFSLIRPYAPFRASPGGRNCYRTAIPRQRCPTLPRQDVSRRYRAKIHTSHRRTSLPHPSVRVRGIAPRSHRHRMVSFSCGEWSAYSCPLPPVPKTHYSSPVRPSARRCTVTVSSESTATSQPA